MDYDSEYEDISTEPPNLSTTEYTELSKCLYDMCVEQQRPCKDLAIAKRCLCPGLDESETPSPPRILKVSQEDGKGVEVRWCAPTSKVTHYVVSVEGKDKVIERNIKVEERKRAAVLGDVAAGEIVCVEAVNYAGVSKKNSQSCMTYEPQTSDSGLALKQGIIGGVVGLLVVLIVALLLWMHKKRQKSTARTKRSEGVF